MNSCGEQQQHVPQRNFHQSLARSDKISYPLGRHHAIKVERIARRERFEFTEYDEAGRGTESPSQLNDEKRLELAFRR